MGYRACTGHVDAVVNVRMERLPASLATDLAKRSQREGKDDQGIFWGMQKSLRDRFLCSRIRMDKSDKRLFCFGEIP